MNKTILIIIVAAILGIGGYFLLKGGYKTPASAPAPAALAPTAQTAKEFTVSGTEFNLNPSSITVKTGERVKITFRNNGGVSHNLVIEGLGISTKTIGGGKTDTIEFIAPAPGTYNIFCSLPGHRASGMEGKLIVE